MLRSLYGFEELECPDRDEIDNYEAYHSFRRWDATLYRPRINEILWAGVPEWREKVRWPGGRAFAACLTHDLDSVQVHSRREMVRTVASLIRQSRDASQAFRHSLSLVGLRHTPLNLDMVSPWIDAERKRGFRSTFFVFPTRVRRRHPRDCTYRWDDPTWYLGQRCSVREMLRDVSERGWGIGLHGSLYSALDGDLLLEEKEDVEACLGRPIYSTRQHNLRFDIRQTPAAQTRAGFQTDSTLGFNRDVGFRNGIAYPFPMRDVATGEPLGLLEIPLVLHDGALLREDNLSLGLDSALRVCRLLIDRVAETKGVITLLWHPDRLCRPQWFQLYELLLDYIVEKNGWGASTKDVRDWWVGQGLEGEMDRALKKVSSEQ